jgi:hypothetical protein
MNFANFALGVRDIVSEMTLSEAASLEVEFRLFDQLLPIGEIRVDRINSKVYINAYPSKLNTSPDRRTEKEVEL